MYKERSGGGGGGSSRSEILGGAIDRKRINDALNKKLEKSSTSTTTSRVFSSKDKDPFSFTSTKTQLPDVESETDSEGSDVSGSEGDDTSWISWFCNLRGNDFFCEVDEDYIQDDFNLCGLSGEMFTDEQHEMVESAAEMLYGLIHVRYILTTKGMAAMTEKYKNCDFGRCPRVFCCGQSCLPVGQSDIPRSSTVKIYCPKCEDISYPRSKFQDIDGAYFGTTFPHLFLMTYGNLKPQKPTQSYVPKIFGFKVHKP
ncbi:unnamed protein product [Arabidopsis thaliana]|uniref:Casein kinase II subunit beta n=1 Tax=Arabidopsis thaliana TaxID=3702 RepID=A0A7G2EVI7_ARATH|nr:unnamed protein product [Arabidopsis thaliana]